MNNLPRPEPKPRCLHCKDGGASPFYKVHEEYGSGQRTGRVAIMCHTCYHLAKEPIYDGQITHKEPASTPAPAPLEDPDDLLINEWDGHIGQEPRADDLEPAKPSRKRAAKR